ncbi:Ca2+:H+ antiporter [Phyllobacterium sp. CL33Tsu]|uniref:calcium:proton antiporter n=1 Tax=Phyllobacterium TaxID=28100 RepID=UPI0008ED0A2D|nr:MULTISPECIES: ionic transporter [unclassified Phyllobacterium]UGY10308.1 ionic transporter [Phyllobacterium sp. T1018]SFI69708.1 Ca2+:H+ antiporter [Phyllobacterium sp. CL33Tsu]
MAPRPISIHRYLIPIACLALAVGIQVAKVPVGAGRHGIGIVVSALAIALLLATVFVVLQHAEGLALRLGQPYGTLLLTFAVTTVEVSIILAMMLHGENNPTLARESVFSTVMIVCAGVVGLCLTLGSMQHRQQEMKRQGTSAILSVLTALAVLTLILPNFTLHDAPGTFSRLQLTFVSICSALLYGSFVFAQTVRHRDDFVDDIGDAEGTHAGHAHPGEGSWINAVLLMIGLFGIVLLAERVAIGVENGLDAIGVQQADAIVGALIATLVLLPEALSAIRAAMNNELQRSLNIALGSALATIGLTIPSIGIASVITGRELTLGLPGGDSVLLALILGISIHSFGTGRTNVLTGLVHLVVFVAFILLVTTK